MSIPLLRKGNFGLNHNIEVMKSQNIQFVHINEEDAINIMQTEYTGSKLLSYAPLFDRYRSTEKVGKYIDLDFAYLYDLAIIDSHFMKLIISMCIDLERIIKTFIIADFERVNDSGNIIYEFVKENAKFFSEVYSFDNIEYASKYLMGDESISELSVYTFLEIIHFGTIQRFARYFYGKFGMLLYDRPYAPFERYLDSIRRMRNPAAHNNGIICQLAMKSNKESSFEKNTRVLSFLGSRGILHRTLDTNMSKQVIHDFCCLLHMYVGFMPERDVKNTLLDIEKFLQEHCTSNSAYYRKTPELLSAYHFLSAVVNIYKLQKALDI